MSIEKEDENFRRLLDEACQAPKETSMKELFECMDKWEAYPTPVLYWHAGECYLCLDTIPVPAPGKHVDFSDILCERCKKGDYTHDI